MEEKWEDVDDVVESRSTSKDALIVAGAILLGCLIISGTLAYVSARGVKTVGQVGSETTADQAAKQPDAVKVDLDQIKALFTDKNIMFGKKDSKVLFVEFSDPSCPFCHVAAGKNPELNKQAGAQFTVEKDGGTYLPPVPEMKKLVDSGKAAFVWLYANGHGNGELATKALYCAKEKGKFWEVHDLLMSAAGYDLMNEKVKNDVAKSGEMADFLKSATKADDMKKCLESGKYDDRIAGDMAIAQKIGFKGTPSFFVNTTNFAGAYSYKDMASAVEEALKK
ncbi:MAG: DsbA family protein [Candidatus Moranbacteria bacterium]|nr:DsbA family protein [Candidatus Moranbacteria bacterium]